MRKTHSVRSHNEAVTSSSFRDATATVGGHGDDGIRDDYDYVKKCHGLKLTNGLGLVNLSCRD